MAYTSKIMTKVAAIPINHYPIIPMRTIVDLHIHSKYARACSPLLTPQNLALWADKKGMGVLGTGDFTHPKWMEDLSELREMEEGLYGAKDSAVRFMYTAEIASIYKQGDKLRRVHNLVFAPTREVAQEFNKVLEERGANLKSDGRPIMGIHCDDLVKIAKDVHEDIEVVPAHAWTPHFGVFGSLSGFNSLEEAFGDQTKYIWAIETGLSSDPAMNWQVESLDNITLISNSDPHSLHRLGREANVLDIDSKKLSYTEVIRVFKERNVKEFLYTIEFFPEEGRYHLDGHRDCKFSCSPERTNELGGVCPVCGRQLLRGVQNRVEALATRSLNMQPDRSIPFRNVLSLEEVIAQVYGVGPGSKKVQSIYERMVERNTEFEILLDMSASDIEKSAGASISAAVEKMRQGNLHIQPGYDGEYGKVELYTPAERLLLEKKPAQLGLF